MAHVSRPPLTDSPWFWLYVFATAGVLSLLWMGPKFGARQSQLDRQFQGRQHAAQGSADENAPRPFSSAESRVRSLQPLYLVLTGAILLGWLILWWQRFRAPAASAAESSPPRPPDTSS